MDKVINKPTNPKTPKKQDTRINETRRTLHKTPDDHSSKDQSDNEQFTIVGYTNKYAGRVTLYPTNNTGLVILKMIHGRRQSFTSKEIKILKSIGYKIKVVEQVIDVDWENE